MGSRWIDSVALRNPQALFAYLMPRIDALGPVYVHLIEGATGGPRDNIAFDYGAIRRAFHGAYIANNGYDRAMAIEKYSQPLRPARTAPIARAGTTTG